MTIPKGCDMLDAYMPFC